MKCEQTTKWLRAADQPVIMVQKPGRRVSNIHRQGAVHSNKSQHSYQAAHVPQPRSGRTPACDFAPGHQPAGCAAACGRSTKHSAQVATGTSLLLHRGPASLQKGLAPPPSQPQPALICSLPFKWCRRRDRPLPVQALCLRSSLYSSDIPVKKQQSTPGGSKSHSGRLLAAPGGTHALGRAPVSAGSAGATVPVGHQLVDAR